MRVRPVMPISYHNDRNLRICYFLLKYCIYFSIMNASSSHGCSHLLSQFESEFKVKDAAPKKEGEKEKTLFRKKADLITVIG